MATKIRTTRGSTTMYTVFRISFRLTRQVEGHRSNYVVIPEYQKVMNLTSAELGGAPPRPPPSGYPPVHDTIRSKFEYTVLNDLPNYKNKKVNLFAVIRAVEQKDVKSQGGNGIGVT